MVGVAQPSRDEALALPQLRLSRHPLVAHKLTLLRRTVTDVPLFRRIVAELTYLLSYEATADLPLAPRQIETPLAPMAGARIAAPIAIIPILRAGLGMIDGFLDLMPEAQVWHIGLFRDERTLRPIEYYNKLPSSATVAVCLVLDPMLATGGSAGATIEILKKWGAKRVKYVGIIAAPEGVNALTTAHPDVPIHVAAAGETSPASCATARAGRAASIHTIEHALSRNMRGASLPRPDGFRGISRGTRRRALSKLASEDLRPLDPDPCGRRRNRASRPRGRARALPSAA